MLRFLLQLGACVIPKTQNFGRLEENLNIYDFEISLPDMEKLTLLDRNERIITPHDRDFMSLPLFD
jgi:diketogulonate reductase-like aldo/keto reductase